jgi:hypothetical protein
LDYLLPTSGINTCSERFEYLNRISSINSLYSGLDIPEIGSDLDNSYKTFKPITMKVPNLIIRILCVLILIAFFTACTEQAPILPPIDPGPDNTDGPQALTTDTAYTLENLFLETEIDLYIDPMRLEESDH